MFGSGVLQSLSWRRSPKEATSREGRRRTRFREDESAELGRGIRESKPRWKPPKRQERYSSDLSLRVVDQREVPGHSAKLLGTVLVPALSVVVIESDLKMPWTLFTGGWMVSVWGRSCGSTTMVGLWRPPQTTTRWPSPIKTASTLTTGNRLALIRLTSTGPVPPPSVYPPTSRACPDSSKSSALRRSRPQAITPQPTAPTVPTAPTHSAHEPAGTQRTG